MVNDVFIPERRTLSTTPTSRTARAPGSAAARAPDVRRDLVRQLHRRHGRAGGRRGARLSRGVRSSGCSRKSSNIDDGLTVNMARYAQAAAQVDAVHALTLQDAAALRTRASREVSRHRGAPSAAATRPSRPRPRASDQHAVRGVRRQRPVRELRLPALLARRQRRRRPPRPDLGLGSVAWTRSLLGLPTPPGWTFTRA